MKKKMKAAKQNEGRCVCPYCEEEMVISSSPLCQACGVVFLRCLECGITVLDREAKNCPKCGAPLS